MLRQFITAGCSFTAGSSSIDVARNTPDVWPDFLLTKINPAFFYNIAVPGNGNHAIGTNLTYLLETKTDIKPEDTLIGINITGLERIDIMCAVNHPDANKYFSWDKDFGYGWITENIFVNKIPPFHGTLQKNMELAQVQRLNAIAIIKCFSYLELKKFNYFFMVMDHYVIEDSPQWFLDFLNARQDKWVTLEGYKDMWSFSKDKNLLAEDKLHPTVQGQQYISNIVMKHLIDKKLIIEYNT